MQARQPERCLENAEKPQLPEPRLPGARPFRNDGARPGTFVESSVKEDLHAAL